MDYLVLKLLHVALALISITGFLLRWTWKIGQSPLADLRVTRVLPHVVDTVFLATGLLLAATVANSQGAGAWLTAKILGLVLYVLLGMGAMRAVGPKLRIACFVGAVLTFAWIVSVARLKTPWGLFDLLA